MEFYWLKKEFYEHLQYVLISRIRLLTFLFSLIMSILHKSGTDCKSLTVSPSLWKNWAMFKANFLFWYFIETFNFSNYIWTCDTTCRAPKNGHISKNCRLTFVNKHNLMIKIWKKSELNSGTHFFHLHFFRGGEVKLKIGKLKNEVLKDRFKRFLLLNFKSCHCFFAERF